MGIYQGVKLSLLIACRLCIYKGYELLRSYSIYQTYMSIYKNILLPTNTNTVHICLLLGICYDIEHRKAGCEIRVQGPRVLVENGRNQCATGACSFHNLQ